tara:strand:- start:43923 stop:45560 length:1638 start_codon:yes stop_codon:yes gene_type:complete
MILKRSVLLVLLVSLVLQAQEGELTLDPNDIPLTPDPTLDVPTDSTNTIQVPNLDNAVPEPTAPVPDTVTQPVTPPQAAPTPAPAPVAPAPAPRIEEHKPTPSNLEVKSDSTADSQKKEERFSRDYTKFHKDSTSEQNWEKVVGKRTSDTYIVNKGDTLWDISGTLFGDPFYWPKIWSLNKDLIYNPHVIFPDMKIKFYQGSSKAAPTLATDNSKTQAPVEMAQVAKHEDAVTPPAVGTEETPKNIHIGRGSRKLPKFFQDYKASVKREIEVQVEEQKEAPVEARITQEFYIAEQPMAAAGHVVEIHNDYGSAGDGIYVFIKFDGQPEGTYTILKPGRRLRPPSKEMNYDVEIYETEGEVKVLGKVNTEENVYRAKVIRTNTLVSPGSIAVPGKMKTFKISDADRETTASKGRIIGNLSDFGTVGQGSFVVINQGAQTGYHPNMSLPIFEELEVRNRATLKSFVKENPQRIGTVTIVDATANYSVGYITKVIDAISVNDIVAVAEGGEFNPGAPRAENTGNDALDAAPATESAPTPAEEAPIEEF